MEVVPVLIVMLVTLASAAGGWYLSWWAHRAQAYQAVDQARAELIIVPYGELLAGARSMWGIAKSPDRSSNRDWEQRSIEVAETALCRLDIEDDPLTDDIIGSFQELRSNYYSAKLIAVAEVDHTGMARPADSQRLAKRQAHVDTVDETFQHLRTKIKEHSKLLRKPSHVSSPFPAWNTLLSRNGDQA